MKKPLTAVLLFFSVSFWSQTGPGGVGTSATNCFWIKADAGTSSSVNATAISSWNDQSGNGNNLSQSTANQQPVYTTNVINGFPAIQFDNVSTTNDKMVGSDSPTLDNTSGLTFFYGEPSAKCRRCRPRYCFKTYGSCRRPIVHAVFLYG